MWVTLKPSILSSTLLANQNPLVHTGADSSSLLERLLLLLSSAETAGGDMVTVNVVKILDLVDTDNPILTGKSLLQSVESRSLRRHSGVSNTINGSSRGEHASVVVVRHLVPERRKLA
jgi:hypothetical protein